MVTFSGVVTCCGGRRDVLIPVMTDGVLFGERIGVPLFYSGHSFDYIEGGGRPTISFLPRMGWFRESEPFWHLPFYDLPTFVGDTHLTVPTFLEGWALPTFYFISVTFPVVVLPFPIPVAIPIVMGGYSDTNLGRWRGLGISCSDSFYYRNSAGDMGVDYSTHFITVNSAIWIHYLLGILHSYYKPPFCCLGETISVLLFCWWWLF